MSLDAAALATRLGPLPLGRARARIAGHHGRHPRRTAGAGDAFWQYRPLEPGEAVARVDWRKSARSDALLVREREREDPVRLLLWADGTGSMDFASAAGLPTKRADAQRLTTALAMAAHAADERVQLLDGGSRPLAETLAHIASEPRHLSPDLPLRPGDAVLLVGDFLDGDAPAWVERAALLGAVGVAMLVFDPAEAAFPFRGRVKFEAAEAGDPEPDIARADVLRSDYLAAWSAHQARLDAIAANPGWTLIRHPTGSDPAEALRQAADWLRG